MTEDETAPPSKRLLIEHPLASWGVRELQAYIAELQEEIARADAAIRRKQDHRQSVESFFRRPDDAA